MPETVKSDSRQPRFWIVGFALLILGTVTLLMLWNLNLFPRQQAGPAGDRDAEETDANNKQRLWDSKERGVALLENHNFQEAAEPFQSIADTVPDDPLGPRNLTIAQLLALETKTATPAEALDALTLLEQSEPDAESTAILAAKMLALTGDRMGAIERLTRFTQQLPDRAAVWFELGELQRDSPEAEQRRLAVASFQRAFELAPDNLAALWNLLQIQAAEKVPAVAETLKAAGPLVEPILATARESGVDLEEQITTGLEAAEEDRLEDLYRQAFIVANVIKAQPFARREGLMLSPHPLAYVLQDFQPRFYENRDIAKTDTTDGTAGEPIAVTFAPLTGPGQLPPLGKVEDFLVAEFDLDERNDLIVLREGRLEVYSPHRCYAWALICASDVPKGIRRILAADLDEDIDEDPILREDRCHDADLDLILVGDSGAIVLENSFDPATGKRSLVRVEQFPEFQSLQEISAAVIFDFDHDAMLDLITVDTGGVSLWQNRGQRKFERTEVIATGETPIHPRTMLAVDWDRDIDLDVILAGDAAHPPGLLRNHRDGKFTWLPWNDEYAALRTARGLTLLDADGNLSWDLVAAGGDGLTLIRTETLDSTVVRVLDSTQLSEQPAEGVLNWDYDNDGILDLLAWSNDGLELFRGLTGGQFELKAGLIDPPPQAIRKCEADDLDHDGDLDLVVSTDTGLVIYENDGGNQNHWLKIRLLAEQVKGGGSPDPGGRVNYHGIGSLLELRTAAGYQVRMVTGQATHIGLGRQTEVRRVRILWPNGFPQNLIDPPTDSYICDQKLLLGSCPYLYTWNGNHFEFCTDLCWAAPLGLKFADGVYAPSRAWEYLKIGSEQLKPRDGTYQLQVTEELWEAAYFDLISLIAVDHPADVEIFSNEKVGPAQIAEYKIHTVHNPHPPLSARDKTGRDLLPELLNADGVFCKPFQQRIKQGLVEDHYLELDLGDLTGVKQITLFLTGWVYPTDTSLNIRLGRDAELPSPQPPSIWVPDKNGVWQQTMPYTGFPGGKTKTIAIDISRAFLTDDFRLRLATNMEFYWDAVFFTTDEEPAEIRTTELKLRSADLHERGFSAIEHPTGHGPDRYVYQRLKKDFRWPPMRGHFTRYGDVAQLLTATDDRMAIIGAGDEITLTFEKPHEPLPAGWKRDFILHNVGWDKDANLNTAYGQDVEPLPFAAMSGYPYPPSEEYPLTPVNIDYLQKYQTRVQDWRDFWRQVADEGSPQAN